MAFDIQGVDNSIKVPGFYGETVFASGALSPAGGAFPVLLVGMRTSAGNLTVDAEVRLIESETQAIAAAGRGSQLHRMYRAAILANPLATIYMAAVTEPSAGTAATVTGLITGTPGEGTSYWYAAGVTLSIPSSVVDTIDTFGARVAAAFTAKADLPFTCTYDSGTDTLTWTHRHKGAGGKDQVLLVDLTGLNGLSVALTGSAALAGDNLVGVKFGAAGTGTSNEDATALIAAAGLAIRRYPRVAVGHNDATNAALWETFVNTQAGPTKLLLEHLVFGANVSLATTTSLAQTTLNAPRAQVVAARNYEVHPSELAAYDAALRAGIENQAAPISTKLGPVPQYDGKILAGLPPQRISGDQWTFAEKNSLLNAGVTPLDTVAGNLTIVRAITTYCTDGSVQDERCLDIGDAVMPDYATSAFQLLWKDFSDKNPGVRDNPVAGEDIPTGIAYPELWLRAVRIELSGFVKNGWIEDRFSDAAKTYALSSGDSQYYKPPQADLNPVSVRIQSEIPIVVSRVNHQGLARVIQTRDLT